MEDKQPSACQSEHRESHICIHFSPCQAYSLWGWKLHCANSNKLVRFEGYDKECHWLKDKWAEKYGSGWSTAVRTMAYCCYPSQLVLIFSDISVFSFGYFTLGCAFCFYCFAPITLFRILNTIQFQLEWGWQGATKIRGKLHKEVSPENIFVWAMSEDLELRLRQNLVLGLKLR